MAAKRLDILPFMRIPFFSYGFLAALCTAQAALAQANHPDAPKVVGALSNFGVFNGDSGILASTEPGLNEFFASCITDSSFWYAHRYDAQSGTYVQTYASPLYTSEIRFMDLADLHPSPGEELMVLQDNGLLSMFRQSTKVELLTVDIGVESITAYAQADVDQDGVNEFALIASTGLHIFEADGSQFAHYPTLFGEDLVIGQMDGDPGLELAVTDGSILDLATGTIQCSWHQGFGFDMELSDWDGDGIEEMVVAEKFDWIWAFDADTCTQLWGLPIFDTDVLKIADVDQDGVEELIVGEGQHGDILAFELSTQTLLWNIENPGHGVNSILCADVNQDGIDEIVWATDAKPGLMVGDFITQSVSWEANDFEGRMLGPLLGDVDGDGVDEIISSSTRSRQSSEGRIVVWDADTLTASISGKSRWMDRTAGIQLFDIDGDNDMEIVIGGNDSRYGGVIEIFDYTPSGEFIPLWRNNNGPDHVYFYCVEVVDLDQDGTLEVVGAGTATVGADRSRVYVYDYASGDEKWRSQKVNNALHDWISKMAIYDFDGDGQLEIAAMMDLDDVFIFGNDSVLEHTIDGRFTSMGAAPYVPGLRRPLLLGDKWGDVTAYQWNGAGYQSIANLHLASDRIDGFTMLGGSRMVASIVGTLNLYDYKDNEFEFESEAYGDFFGSSVVPLSNGDFVTAGEHGLFIFGKR
jgi:hypothetical protein